MVRRFPGCPAVLTTALLAVASPVGAQHAAALRTGAAPPPIPSAPVSDAALVPPSQYPSVWRYVGTGALIGGGAAALAVAVAYAQGPPTDCIGCVMAVPVVIGGGAALGAATGYIVHRIRFY